ncbi:S-adenosyl-L-methionine-dependent methyltransferases superfamily protein [Tanacetum coccineum]
MTDNDSNITGMKSHDCHIMMQQLLPYGLQEYLDTDVAKPIIELCSFFQQICARTLMEDDMVKAESQLVDILCNLEQIYPSAFFDTMIHLAIHLPQEALEGRPIPYRWIPEIDTYLTKFKREFPNKDMKQEFPGWPRARVLSHYLINYIDKDPSITDELFSLACGPSSDPILVNSCLVNGVRFVVHSRDKRRTTQNTGICSPGEKDGEMYYGQLEEILKGVIKVEDDHDVIHDNNSSDLTLSTSLNDLDFATLNIDGQSTDVEAPPDIIDVDEDGDFINDEDDFPHDLADYDDKVLANDDDDDDETAIIVYSSDEED